MSTPAPDPTPDLTTAAFRELKKLSATLKFFGVGFDEDWDPWLFAWRPEVSVNGTGLCSVVVSSVRPWASPNRHNTGRFPELQLEVYADVNRDEKLAPDHRTAQRKAEDVWRVVDPTLHRPDRRGLSWGDANGALFIVSSTRNQEPRIEEVPETDGTFRLTTSYAVEML